MPPTTLPRVPCAAILLMTTLLVSSDGPAGAGEEGKTSRPLPPPSRVETVTETVHGVRVEDPYRWLEQGDGEEVRRWVEAQNGYTRASLEARPGRAAVRDRISRLLGIGTLGTPVPRGGLLFYTKREGTGQNQPILYVRAGDSGTDRVLVDPNRLSADGTAALDWWFPSEDGALLAYGVSTGGDEKSTLRILKVATGEPLPDTIPHTRYCSVAWLPDNSGFYYTRYPAPGEVPAGQENYNRHVFFHRLGSDPKGDPKVFGAERKPEEMIEVGISPEGRWLLITVHEGWNRTDLYALDLAAAGRPPVPIAEGLDAIFAGEAIGDTLYLMTNLEAPRYRLFAVDLKEPQRARWRLLIPERDSVLNQAVYAGGRIVAHYLKDASSRVVVFDRDGREVREAGLPALGTVDTITGHRDGGAAWFGFSSFTVPPAVYRHEVATGKTALWQQVKADVDLSAFEVRQAFYPSKDGTRVSLFLVHRKGIRKDGANPTLLYGYGGFNVTQTPVFSRGVVLWLERGGVYAMANLRGGGEFGEAWHRAGMRDRKQNVFDDFVAAGEWLIREKYTRPDRLAIQGGSNGGLLVGAALTQRPDLFRAVLCAVPLLDMVRYHHFQIAKLWIPEYGSADDPEAFRWLHAYSPYHRVREATRYPAVLLTTAESDSRVDPMHARKMAARLQAATASGLPVLLRTETRAGHGAGKPVAKMIDEQTDSWTFLLWQLGVEGAAAAPAPGS